MSVHAARAAPRALRRARRGGRASERLAGDGESGGAIL